MNDQLPQMPKECVEAFEEISKIGAAKGYQPNSWKNESPERHIGKALGHIAKWWVVIDKNRNWTSKGEEDHLLHAMWRVCAAVTQVVSMRAIQTNPPS